MVSISRLSCDPSPVSSFLLFPKPRPQHRSPIMTPLSCSKGSFWQGSGGSGACIFQIYRAFQRPAFFSPTRVLCALDSKKWLKKTLNRGESSFWVPLKTVGVLTRTLHGPMKRCKSPCTHSKVVNTDISSVTHYFKAEGVKFNPPPNLRPGGSLFTHSAHFGGSKSGPPELGPGGITFDPLNVFQRILAVVLSILQKQHVR